MSESRDVPADATPPGWRVAGDEVERLDPDLVADGSGWLTVTGGSRHIWERVGGRIYWTRLPGVGRSRFLGDGDRHRLTRIDAWPEVGSVFFVWFDDPKFPLVMEQWRQSSRIKRIVRIEREWEGDEPAADENDGSDS